MKAENTERPPLNRMRIFTDDDEEGYECDEERHTPAVEETIPLTPRDSLTLTDASASTTASTYSTRQGRSTYLSYFRSPLLESSVHLRRTSEASSSLHSGGDSSASSAAAMAVVPTARSRPTASASHAHSHRQPHTHGAVTATLGASIHGPAPSNQSPLSETGGYWTAPYLRHAELDGALEEEEEDEEGEEEIVFQNGPSFGSESYSSVSELVGERISAYLSPTSSSSSSSSSYGTSSYGSSYYGASSTASTALTSHHRPQRSHANQIQSPLGDATAETSAATVGSAAKQRIRRTSSSTGGGGGDGSAMSSTAVVDWCRPYLLSSRWPSLWLAPRHASASTLPRLLDQHRRQLEHYDSKASLQVDSDAPPDQHMATTTTFAMRSNVEHWDFCLVLQPQQVYGYWAELLDFRTEYQLPVEDVDNPDEASVLKEEDVDDDPPEEDSRMATTPLTGVRHRRRNTTTTADRTQQSLASPLNAFGLTSPSQYSVLSRSSHAKLATGSARKSLFERAVQTSSVKSLYGTPTGGSSSSAHRNGSTPSTIVPMSSLARRRWGSRIEDAPPGGGTPSTAGYRAPSTAERRPPTDAVAMTSGGEVPPNTDPHIIRLEDIPPQRLARGVAARTNGLIGFLAALKQGIVVRLHFPNKTAVWAKLDSPNGGDTIRFVVLDEHRDDDRAEALHFFREQRVRYHTARYRAQQPDAAPWSLDESDRAEQGDNANRENDSHTGNRRSSDPFVPDYVAAQKLQQQRHQRLQKSLQNAARRTKGSIAAADIAVVHPAVFADPRSPGTNELGTSTFRRSKSDYNPTLSFSLVLRKGDPHSLLPPRNKHARPTLDAASTIDEFETKWLTGQGSESQFKYVDIETATLGEYWLLFRGFLLLHRDAAVGRFSEHRVAGIGSHYSRIELEQRQNQHLDQIRLHENEYHEPATAGCWERLMVKVRGDDPDYLQGYVLDTAKDPPPSDYFLGFSSPGTAIWSRLRQAGLETSRVYSLDPNRVMIKVRCPTYRLLDVAEVLKLKVRTHDGSYVVFSADMMDMYPPGFLRSSVRQGIISFIIGSRIRDSGAELGPNTQLGRMVQARVPLHMHEQLDALFRSWFWYWKSDNWALGRDGRSMTMQSTNKRLLLGDGDRRRKDDVEEGTVSEASTSSVIGEKSAEEYGQLDVPNVLKRLLLGSFHQPLDSIEEYFGEKVAFYFAWLQHTASHLVFLTVIGLVVFVCQVTSGNWDHPLRPFFSLVVMIWTFVVLTNWRKRANFLAHRWGTLNYKEQETTRPQFRGDYARDEITGEWIVTYPSWKRWLKYSISIPLTLLSTFGSLVLIFWVHGNRDAQLANYYEKKSNGTEPFHFSFSFENIFQPANTTNVSMSKEVLRDPTFWFITAGMPMLLGLFLPLLNLILMKVSVLLNEFENYRTESEYRTHLIIKVFSFRFVCYFATLYYYAFMPANSEEDLQNSLFRYVSRVCT